MFKVLIDTSVIVDYFRGFSEDLKQLEILRTEEKIDLLIPHPVIIELFVGQEAKKKSTRKKLDDFLEGFEIVGLSLQSAKMAGDFIRNYPQIPEPFDLIISAISIEQKAKIATHNKKHFKQIKGIDLFQFN